MNITFFLANYLNDFWSLWFLPLELHMLNHMLWYYNHKRLGKKS